MRNRHAALVIATALILTTACDPAAESVKDPAELPSEPAFTPGPETISVDPADTVWVEGSTIHVNEETYDAGGVAFVSVGVTPYGFILRKELGAPDNYFLPSDGSEPQPIDGAKEIRVSESGEYVAWLAEGPEVESDAKDQHADKVVVAEAATGQVIFESTEGLMKGSDYPEEYSPRARGFIGETFYWNQEFYGDEVYSVDAATLETDEGDYSEVEDELESGLSAEIASQVESGEYGSVTLSDRQGKPIDLGYPFVFALDAQVGPISEATILVKGQQENPNLMNLASTDRAGKVFECDLVAGECSEVARLTDAGLTAVAYG